MEFNIEATCKRDINTNQLLKWLVYERLPKTITNAPSNAIPAPIKSKVDNLTLPTNLSQLIDIVI